MSEFIICQLSVILSIFYNVIGCNSLHFDEIYCMVVHQQALKIQNIVVNIRTILATKLEL